MASPSTVLSLGYGSWGSVDDVITLGYDPEVVGPYTALNYFVVLPGVVTPVQLPAMSAEGFEIWEERALSDGDTRVLSDGSARVIADSLLNDVKLQIAVVELPPTVATVQVE